MTPSFLFRLGVLTALLAAAFPAQAQPEQKPPSVSVTGEANITAAPDIAIVQAGVTSQARTAREAMAGSGKLMTAVLAVFKDSGISEKDIKLSLIHI